MKRLLNKLGYIWIASILIFSQYASAAEKSVDVTATVQPQPADVTITISADKIEGSEIALNEIVTFTISYQVRSYTGFPLEVVGSWEQGLIEGTSTYVDVYDYVLGSATDAQDSTPPVIDLLNHTITWSMPSVSYSSSPYEVSFQLKIKDSFLTQNRILVNTNADATYGSALAPQQDYLFYVNSLLSITPTFTPTPQTPTPTPTIIKTLKFDQVRIDDVGAEKVRISVMTNIDSLLEVRYGQCLTQSFDQRIRSSEVSRYHELEFENLTPDAVYCFQIIASNTLLGQKIQSDIFTFHTAREDIGVRIQATSILWQNIRLNSQSVKNLGIPRDILIVITLDIENSENLALLEGEFVNRSVLGLTTASSPNIQKVDFIEIAPGVFSSEIMTPYLVDGYYFTLRIKDDFGGFTKLSLPYSFQVADPIKIVDENEQPIENVLLQIERFEESRKEYVLLNNAFPQSPALKSFFQPYYSDQDGYVFVALPVGRYRMTATAIGYEKKTQEFFLGDDFISYPKLTLQSQFSFSTAIEYLSFSVLTAYEVFMHDIQLYFSTHLLKTVLLLYESLMFLFVMLFGIEKFGLLSKLHSKIGRIFADFNDELFHHFMSIWSITTVSITIFFIVFQGWQSALIFIGITAIVALLDIYIFIRHERNL